MSFFHYKQTLNYARCALNEATVVSLEDMQFSVTKTYDIVTPESAKDGDVEDEGFEYRNKIMDTEQVRQAIEEIGIDHYRLSKNTLNVKGFSHVTSHQTAEEETNWLFIRPVEGLMTSAVARFLMGKRMPGHGEGIRPEAIDETVRGVHGTFRKEKGGFHKEHQPSVEWFDRSYRDPDRDTEESRQKYGLESRDEFAHRVYSDLDREPERHKSPLYQHTRRIIKGDYKKEEAVMGQVLAQLDPLEEYGIADIARMIREVAPEFGTDRKLRLATRIMDKISRREIA